MIPKFRAWDKVSKCMCSVDYMNLYDEFYEFKCFKKDKSMLRVADFYDKSAILMQSTGFKDKNGTEVFEGDIVKPIGFPRWIGTVQYLPDRATFAIKKHSNDCLRGNLIFLSQFFARGVEILGNIYENLELLKEISKEK